MRGPGNVPAEVEREVVRVPGVCLPAPTWKYVGVLWTPYGVVQVFLKPVAPLRMELAQASVKDEA